MMEEAPKYARDGRDRRAVTQARWSQVTLTVTLWGRQINVFMWPIASFATTTVSKLPANRMQHLSRRIPQLRCSSRTYASLTSSPINPTSVGPFQVFDRNAKRIQKDRAAARNDGEASRTVDYVRDEVAERMIERFMVCSYFCVFRARVVES